MRISLGPDPSSLSPPPIGDRLDDRIERVVAYGNLETYLLEQVNPEAYQGP